MYLSRRRRMFVSRAAACRSAWQVRFICVHLNSVPCNQIQTKCGAEVAEVVVVVIVVREGGRSWGDEGLWRGWQLCVLSGLVMVFSVYDCYATSNASESALIELRNCYVCTTIFHTQKHTHIPKLELLPGENSRALLIICVNVERGEHSESQTRVMRKLSRRLLIFSTKIWVSFGRHYTYIIYIIYEVIIKLDMETTILLNYVCKF